MKMRSATTIKIQLATGAIIAAIAASILAAAVASHADTGGPGGKEIAPELDAAQIACLSNYAIASFTAIAEMTATSPRAESEFEQAAIRTEGTLLAPTRFDFAEHDWSACPDDFRHSRDIALDARAQYVAVVATFRGGNYQPNDYLRLTEPGAVLDAAVADFTEIYSGYLNEPAVIARVDAWLEGGQPDQPSDP